MKHLATLAVGSLMFALVAFMLPTAHAAEGQISSTVTIECPAEVIADGGSLDFGYLAAPTTGCDFWTVTPFNGEALGHSGSGDGYDFLPGDHSKGSFSLKGSEPITYDVGVLTQFADPNLTLNDLTLDPLSPQDPSPDNRDCLTIEISVGGTLEVCPGAVSTLHNDAVILITANY